MEVQPVAAKRGELGAERESVFGSPGIEGLERPALRDKMRDHRGDRRDADAAGHERDTAGQGSSAKLLVGAETEIRSPGLRPCMKREPPLPDPRAGHRADRIRATRRRCRRQVDQRIGPVSPSGSRTLICAPGSQPGNAPPCGRRSSTVRIKRRFGAVRGDDQVNPAIHQSDQALAARRRVRSEPDIPSEIDIFQSQSNLRVNRRSQPLGRAAPVAAAEIACTERLEYRPIIQVLTRRFRPREIRPANIFPLAAAAAC